MKIIKRLFLCFMLFLSVFPTKKAFAAGCTFLIDYATGGIIRNEGSCEERYSPASTFKIALALMGYDAGILQDEHTPAWPFEKEYTANKDNDRQTTDPVLWEKYSVVWYSQKLTTLLGQEKFQHYVDQFNYGNKDLRGDPGKANGLTRALMSSLQISPREQAYFIQNMLGRHLQVSAKAYEMTEAILPRFPLANGWTVIGKTGSGNLPGKDGLPDKNRPQGWFVGWAEKEKRKVIFVKLILGDEPSDVAGWKARDRLLAEFPRWVE